jgi:hypothetical protein
MTPIEIARRISEALKADGFLELSNELTDILSTVTIAGEMVARIGKLLKDSQYQYPDAYALIAKDYEEFLSFYPYLKLI